MRITDRARAALTELLAHRYAVPSEATGSAEGREYYRGADAEPSLGALGKAAGVNPFDPEETGWATFERIPTTPEEAQP